MAVRMKCILAYGLSKEEYEKLKRLPYKVIEITKEMGNMKVSEIIDVNIEETPNDEEIREKVIFYNDFMPQEMNKMIQTTRKIVKGGILAVVTPISKNWSVNYYVDHLIKEREVYSKK